MENIENIEKNKEIASFIKKLYNLVQDESSNEIIQWDESGESFIISNINLFET